MEDQTGERLTLSQAAERAATELNVKLSYNQIWRAARRGTRSRDGQRIFLKCERYGGKLYTSLAWLREHAMTVAKADQNYFEQQAAQQSPAQPLKPIPSKAKQSRGQRQNQFIKADNACKDAGF